MKNKFTLLKNLYFVSTCGMIRTLLFFLGNIMLVSIINAQVLKPRRITPNGPIFDMERMGNTLYVAGSFDKVGYSTGAAALIPIGDTLPNLNLPSFSSKILTAVPDGSGGWYIGGEFTGVNHFSQSNLVHILPSMAVDTSFKPNPDGRVNTLIIKDNKLYVGGGFTHMFGVAKNFLAAIDLSTKALTSFNPAPDGEVRCLLINGSNLLVAGLFNHIASTAHRVLAKINLTTFQSDSIPAPVSGGMNVLLMKGDTLFAGGSFNSNIGSNTGPNRQGILAISLSKNTLLPWAPKVSGFGFGQRINALACIDSIIYMGGYFGTINGQTRTNFGAVNVSGSLSPFNPSPNNEVYGLATHNDSLYVGGLFTQISSLPRPYAVKFGKHSVIPSKWSLNPNAYVNSFAFDNKNLMVGGGFYMLHYVERNNSCAFELPSLKLLPWKPFSNFLTINDIQTDQGLNRVYLVGYDSQTSRHLKAFDAISGDSITGWHPVFNNSINKVALDKTSHHVYAAGRFTTVNQISKHRLAVLDKDGNLLNQPIDIDNEVRDVVILDTSVYICGLFKNINGQPRNKIGSLNLLGKITNWAPQTDIGQFEPIEEIEALPDRINVGGYFSTAGGQTHQAIAAFDPKTGNVINWNPKLQALRASYIRTVGNGMFVADQSLTSVSNYFVRQLAFFDTNSSYPLADFLKYGFDQVFAVEPLDSLVIVGGGFTMLDNKYHPYLTTFQMNLSVATSGGIRSVTPSQGGNNGDVTIQVLGSGFKANTTIKLHSNSGNPDISPVKNSLRVRTETLLTVSFDLRGQPLGSRDVIVITPGQTPDTLKNGFEIVTGTEAQPWADVIGPKFIRSFRSSYNYYINYGNKGNIDATGVPLWFAISPELNVESIDFVDIAPNNPNHVNLNDVPKYVRIDTLLGKPYNAKVYAFFLPRIPANSSKVVRVVIKCTAQKVMHMRAWVNPPWYGSPLKYAVGECWDNLISFAFGSLPFGVGCAYNTISLVTTPIFDYAYDVSFDESYAQDFFKNAGITGVGCASDIASGGMGGFILNCISGLLNYTNVPAILKSCSPPEDKEDKEISSIGATDPNDKSGPTGQGAEGWINTKQKFSYLIRFENKASATAPARKVVVRDTLSKNIFDLNTLELKGFSIANEFFPLKPDDLNDSVIFDLRPSIPSLVKVQASLNKTNGELSWIFTALDTLTKKEPIDVRAGFLPPDVDSIIGQAAVLYDIHVSENVPNGTKIKNRAVIYFDFNDPIFTNTWQLTADSRIPESNVHVLADTMKSTKFTLNWSGSDVGSGIRYYNVYFQKDDGYWLHAISSTNKTSMEFKGVAGSHYKFYSVAVDTAMNQEYAPVNADASTYISQSALGIENITTNSWEIYPNPSADIITVEYSKGAASLSISIYDMSGRLVLQKKLQSTQQNSVTLDINKMSAGIYLLKLSDGKNEKQVKFVKK